MKYSGPGVVPGRILDPAPDSTGRTTVTTMQRQPPRRVSSGFSLQAMPRPTTDIVWTQLTGESLRVSLSVS